MKKTLLTLLTIALTAVSAHAQDWKMVITKADGTQMELMTNEINNITGSALKTLRRTFSSGTCRTVLHCLPAGRNPGF